MTLQFAAVKIG